jgi:hypothetical protein
MPRLASSAGGVVACPTSGTPPAEDGDAHPTGPSSPAIACRFSTASPCTPLHHPSSEASDNEASTEVHAIHPSGHSPRLWPPDGTGALGLLPRASNPADQEPATHVRVGTGLERKPGTTLTTSAEPPIRASTRKRATSRRTEGPLIMLPNPRAQPRRPWPWSRPQHDRTHNMRAAASSKLLELDQGDIESPTIRYS